MAQARVKGFVVGSDQTSHGIVWKVKVSEAGPLQGKKLRIASIHGDAALTPGLDVDFVIGSLSPDGTTMPVAADVRIQTLAHIEPALSKPKQNTKDDTMSDTLNLFASELGGKISVYVTPQSSIEEVRRDIKDAGSEDENVVAFASFTRRDLGEAFDLLCGLTVMQEGMESLESLLTGVFKLGITFGRIKP